MLTIKVFFLLSMFYVNLVIRAVKEPGREGGKSLPPMQFPSWFF